MISEEINRIYKYSPNTFFQYSKRGRLALLYDYKNLYFIKDLLEFDSPVRVEQHNIGMTCILIDNFVIIYNHETNVNRYNI